MVPIGPIVFLWAGLDQGCLRDHFRRVRDLKTKKNKRFYGFTDFRGKPEKRGRCSRATANQVTAGKMQLIRPGIQRRHKNCTCVVCGCERLGRGRGCGDATRPVARKQMNNFYLERSKKEFIPVQNFLRISYELPMSRRSRSYCT